jgi:hypothetical protein
MGRANDTLLITGSNGIALEFVARVVGLLVVLPPDITGIKSAFPSLFS